MTLLTTAERSTGSVVLSAVEAAELRGLARAVIPTAGGRIDDPAMIQACGEAAALMPPSLRQALRAYRRDSGEQGTLLVQGLPVNGDSLPCTPRTGGSVQRFATVPAVLLLMVAAELGQPVAFRPEKSGALVQDVVPVAGKEDFQGNAGSVLLNFHNENAFHEHRPDHVMLLCLRADHDRVAGLRTACARQVRPFLGEEIADALHAPEFVTSAPPSFGAADCTSPHSVLSGSPDDPDIRVDLAATEALTPRAQRALDELRVLFDEVAQTLVLDRGELAIVDNRVTVHGRTAFRPRYDGADRWLQRTFVAGDLRRSRANRAGDGHVID